MLQVQEGQCGLCVHFGENLAGEEVKLIQIRLKGEAPELLVEPCGLPAHAELNLMVTPISGCEAFQSALTPQA